MADPKEIYLEPKCCFNREIGRCWSEEDEWPLEEDGWPIDSGHEPATRYIRADLARPRVKRLEWEDAPRGSDGMEVAHAPGGSGIAYLVRDSSERKGCTALWKGFEHYGEHLSREEAKAAAQADFEQRILSALEGDDG